MKSERPEHLRKRDSGIFSKAVKLTTVIRQPYGPDGTKGFDKERKLWNPSGTESETSVPTDQPGDQPSQGGVTNTLEELD